MPEFKVLDVRAHNGQLLVRVEHFDASGSHWFFEDYTWQGREGLKRKRQTNPQGKLLLADGTVAPSNAKGDQYLPGGREWAYLPPPIMDNEAIVSVIRQVHQSRLITGAPYADGRLRTSVPPGTPRDNAGIGLLASKFAGLRGMSF